MVSRASDEFGRIHVLVNNVGWVLDCLFLDQPREDWEKTVNVNLWSVIYCMRAVLPQMVENGYGRIVSISSEAGRVGEYREAVYAACKAGIIGLTKSLAREMGRYGIALNAVCPAVTVPQSEEEIGEHSLWQVGLQVFTPEAQEKAKGGIIIPDTAKEKPMEGKVIAVGSGKLDENGKRIALEVKVGNKVLFGKYAGTEIKIDNEEHVILREDEILGIIE